jgi:hypothetical protein
VYSTEDDPGTELDSSAKIGRRRFACHKALGAVPSGSQLE